MSHNNHLILSYTGKTQEKIIISNSVVFPNLVLLIMVQTLYQFWTSWTTLRIAHHYGKISLLINTWSKFLLSQWNNYNYFVCL